MKRRRGSGNALKIDVSFSGNPKIRFMIDSEDNQWFNNAVEKIDFVLELLPYHLDPEKLPNDVTEMREIPYIYFLRISMIQEVFLIFHTYNESFHGDAKSFCHLQLQ